MIPESKRKYLIEPEAQLYDAMSRIEANDHRSVIVVSDSGHVVGTLSDGDIRKAILQGRLVQAPVSSVMNTNFISLLDGEREKAPAIFRDSHVFLIPVVDPSAKLIDVLEAY